MKCRICVDLSYIDRETTIREFERIVADLKARGYAQCASGNGANRYFVEGPPSQPLTDSEIKSIRELLIKKDAQ